MMKKPHLWLAALTILIGGAFVSAQQGNPVTIFGIGPSTALTSTMPVSGSVTANVGTTNGLALDSSLTTLDTDVKANIVLAAGTHVIGHVITDSGSTTAVTGNVAVTKADGSDVTLGAKADAKSTATDTTAVSIMSVLKEISAMEQAPASRAVTNTGTFATQSAITAASGSIASGAIASGAIASGAIASGAAAAGAFDSDAVAFGAGSTASAVPSKGTYSSGNGSGNLTGFLRCDNSVVYDTNTNGKTQLVALSSGKVTYVCGVSLTQSTTSAVTVSLGSGTGTNCGTTYTAKTPAWPLQAPTSVAPTGVVLPIANVPWFQTAASEELCVSTNAAVSVQLLVSYTQF